MVEFLLVDGNLIMVSLCNTGNAQVLLILSVYGIYYRYCLFCAFGDHLKLTTVMYGMCCIM
jgi:hypothetical protein